jgi:DNA-binding CsgD family transcriptional regulator
VLYGRDVERRAIDALLADARESHSGVLVLRGEPGVGKSTLLADAVERAGNMEVLRADGFESESELAFAGLHQVLRPLLEHVHEIPAPQAAALRGALGLAPGTEPDRFLISVAVLSLLAAAAETRPLLCLVDDAHWLDQPSAESLTFVARRLEAEPIALIIAARSGEGRTFDAPGLPELCLTGLSSDAADALLSERTQVTLSPEVRDRLVERTGGNPLALLELPQLLTEDQLAGRSPLADPLPLGDTLEAAFLARARDLAVESQVLLLVAAADDTGDPGVVLRAARELGIEPAAFRAAERAGLVSFGERAVEFRHPLVRSAIYHGASLPERQDAHELLAHILEGEEYADRRAWHRAAATAEPDADIAEELERSADRARRRSGYAAAAAAFERAAALTPDDDMRARRLLAAADAAWQAGRPHGAAALLEDARALTSHALLNADIDHLRGAIEFQRGKASQAHAILLAGAAEVATVDPRKAVKMLVSAGEAAGFAGDFKNEIEAARRAEELSAWSEGGTFESAWTVGIGSVLAGDQAKGMPLLRDAVAAAEGSEDARRLLSAGEAAIYLGDVPAARTLCDRAVRAARAAGAVGGLPFALQLLAAFEVIDGWLAAAAANASEGLRLAQETGQENSAAHHLAVLARVDALRGREDDCRRHAGEAFELAETHGLLFQAATASWALGELDLGLGRTAEALSRFATLADLTPGTGHPIIALYTAPDLVEAAVRADRADAAHTALEMFEQWADQTGSPWALALLERCRGLLASGNAADSHFEKAVEHHSTVGRSVEAARTELIYGEFLRRARQRKAAREHLRAALDLFEQVGAQPWAERARAELRASGESARRRDPSTIDELTRQELQIARFVAQGLTNRQVAEQLFLSPRTIDFHLRNVFRKLGIASRNELRRFRLGEDAEQPATASEPAPVAG